VTGGWIKLHNDELQTLYSLPNIIRMTERRCLRWAGHEARIGMRNAYQTLVGKPEGNTAVKTKT
jgi:hypothetical protein